MTKTLLFAPFANWTLHFETDMELAQQSLDSEERLTIVYCDGTLPICEPNPNRVSLMCKMCMARRDNGFKWLNDKAIRYIPLDASAIPEGDMDSIRQVVNSMKSVAEIRDYRLEGSDLGMSAISSTVSFFREPQLEWEKHGSVLQKNLHTALLVHYRLSRLLDSENYDKIILFNGRYSTFRPVLRLAQKRDIELLVHERGPDFKHYSLTKNTYPHDIHYIEDRIVRFSTDSTPDEEKKRIGREWFLERQQHKTQNWKVFTEEQKEGFLPEELSQKSFKIAIFNSSEDEFVAIEEWKNPYYETQNLGIEKILSEFKSSDIHFFLRVHPNLGDIDNSQTKELERIGKKYDNLTLISADSKVSTYDLMNEVDLVITFGSTVGIEASFLNKPSIVMGRAPYLVLNTCIQPISHEAMVQIIKEYKSGRVLPKTEKNSYLFGYYMKSYGLPYKYLHQKGISKAVLEKDGKYTNLSSSFKIYMIWAFRAIRKAYNIMVGR